MGDLQRRELKGAIRDYSHKTNFYKLGLVRKFLLKQKKEERELINAVPKVTCPYCGSRKIGIDYSDDEYSSDRWLYCDDCNESFDDDFGYIEAVSAIEYLCWNDSILIRLYFEEPDIKTEEWKMYCEKEIKKYLDK